MIERSVIVRLFFITTHMLHIITKSNLLEYTIPHLKVNQTPAKTEERTPLRSHRVAQILVGVPLNRNRWACLSGKMPCFIRARSRQEY